MKVEIFPSGRDTLAAATHLATADDERLALLVAHDPDIFREVGAALAALADAAAPLVARVTAWEETHPGGAYPVRDSHRMDCRVGDLRSLRDICRTFQPTGPSDAANLDEAQRMKNP